MGDGARDDDGGDGGGGDGEGERDERCLHQPCELMLEGDDKPLKPALLDVISPTEARVSVTEGRYHMVRRMFAAVGNHVEALHRERLGGLALPDDLAPGEWRLLGQAEIDAIFAGQP